MERAVAWLLAKQVLLPGVSTSNRFCAHVRARGPGAERSNASRLQRFLANVTDVGAHRLRKHASR